MARTSITPQTLVGSYGDYSVADTADLTFAVTTGASGSSGNQFVASGNDILIARNDNAGAQTITFTSINDPYNRTGDIAAYSIGIGEYAVFGAFNVLGWRQTDGKVYFETASADILVAVIQL